MNAHKGAPTHSASYQLIYRGTPPSLRDDASAKPRQHWLEVLLSDGAQAADGAAFISAHELGIANHVGSQDSRKSSLVTGQ